GRPLTNAVEDAGNTVFSATAVQYDVLGRPSTSSNPYTTSPQFWTTNQFDTLGRLKIAQFPDSAQETLSYNLNSTTVSDPSGKQRRTYMDGLGRVIETYEPGDVSPVGAQASGS